MPQTNPSGSGLRRDYALFRSRFNVPASDQLLMKGMVAWAGVMGAINLELFGHLNNVIDTPGALFGAVVELHGQQLISGTSSTLQTSKRV